MGECHLYDTLATGISIDQEISNVYEIGNHTNASNDYLSH